MNENDLSHWRSRWLLGLLLLLGLGLRAYGLTHGISHHPDERHIVSVASSLKLEDMNPHFFAYGSFPFYLLWAISWIAGFFNPFLRTYDGLFLVGRSLAALFGTLAILLTYRLAFKVFLDRRLALVAAALIGFNVFHIQLSHFYAFDIVLCALNLVALLYIVRVPESGAWSHYLLAACAIGVSIGTKISSLSLFIPLSVAALMHLYNRGRDAWLNVAFKLACSVIVAALSFLAVEPYALLDYTRFIADNQEQLEMVAGLRRPPYVIQYANTLPFLYHLQQIFGWTMGWAVGACAVGGTLYLLIRQFRSFSQREVILLAWLIPVFISIAPQQVKFPRYLIPIYPIAMIAAAALLREVGNWLRVKGSKLHALPALLLIAWSLVLALAFKNIYRQQHAYRTASEWIFENIPAGSLLVEGHWDDTLPLHLPGKNPQIYKQEYGAPFYEADTPGKLSTLSSQLAAGDYLIFPTPRLYDSIPRLPDEYPHTYNLFRLLFGGKLGYDLVKSFKVRPSIGPLVFNDDLMDESLSVYDHPKILIFRNVRRLSSQEISNLIQWRDPGARLPSYEEMLLAEAGEGPVASAEPAAEGGSLPLQDSLSPILWLVVLEALALCVTPIVALAMPRSPDRGLGLAKVIGFVLPGFIVWLGTTMGLLRTNRAGILIVMGGLLLCSHLVTRRYFGGWRAFFSKLTDQLVIVESLFLGSYLLFMVMQAFHPEIYWGEKPMDFTFLNYFVRLETLPPEDPWAAGERMHYYYLGTYLCAILHKLTGTDTSFGYNLSMALIPALLICAAYTLLVSVTRRKYLAVAGASLVMLVSDFEVLKLWLVDKKTLNFDLFWASTRLYVSPGITEYPFWSFLFADLHAHVIALPVTAGLLALGVNLLRPCKAYARAPVIASRALYMVLWAALFAINSWDFITYGLLTVFLLAFRPLPKGQDSLSLKGLGKRLLLLSLEGGVLLGGALILIFPYMRASGANSPVGWGWVYDNEFNDLSRMCRLLGHWFVLLAAGWIGVWARGSSRLDQRPRRLLRLSAAILAGFAPLALAGCGYYFGQVRHAPWDMLALCSLMLLMAVYLSWRNRAPLAIRAAGSYCCVGFLLIAGCEQLYLIDRSNTLFKFYNGIWMLFGLASAALWPFIWPRRTRSAWAAALLALGKVASLIVLPVVIVASILNAGVMLTFQRKEGPRPTLDGTAYFHTMSPDEARLTDFMRRRIKGLPVVLEAHGDSYQEYTRIAMHTGIPTVLGWEHHVKQRGTHHDEVDERDRAIRVIYQTVDLNLALELLKSYKVDLIVVGPWERHQYGQDGLAKFSSRPDLFPLLFQSGNVTLYATASSLVGSRPGSPLTIGW